MTCLDPEDLGLSNPTPDRGFADVLAARLERRRVLGGGLTAMVASLFGPTLVGCAGDATAGDEADVIGRSRLRFRPIPPSTDDTVHVADGYEARVFVRWGDPIGAREGAPEFRADASNSAADQALQFGMHHDGMAFFPLPAGSTTSSHGVVCVNHEYIDATLLLGTLLDGANPEHVQKCKNAHGVTVYEVERSKGAWRLVTDSAYARRVTADTPMELTGPAAGHALVRTEADPQGVLAHGTFNNCSNGRTPWGTYLTCEENINGYFKRATPRDTDARYGIGPKASSGDWSAVDARFDLDQEPNEAHRFGWVVEIDPFDPTSTPKKRTALGRFKHENVALTVAPSGHVVGYMGDDEKNEYIYKFVSSGTYEAKKPDRDLLAEGTLYAAKFRADGTGEWLPLVFGEGPLVPPAFQDQAEVLVFARRAADAVGATKMDRPEWLAVHPQTGDVYCTCTNNNLRGTEKGPPPDAANPRAVNDHGHIVRWREADPTDRSFTWDLFLLGGDPAAVAENHRGNMVGDVFSAPDGLAIDPDGIVWIMTDVSTSSLFHPTLNPTKASHQAFGNNQMLAIDPREGVVKRFLTGPVGAEITGFALTPDQETLFVNVQHPGEPLGGGEASDPANPTKFSTWPDGPAGGRPRSATLVITKKGGGKIGS